MFTERFDQCSALTTLAVQTNPYMYTEFQINVLALCSTQFRTDLKMNFAHVL